MQTEKQIQQAPSTSEQKRAVRILAKSLYRELTSQGYDDKQIVSLATELLGEVTEKRPLVAAQS